jgi:hypothetical protein
LRIRALPAAFILGAGLLSAPARILAQDDGNGEDRALTGQEILDRMAAMENARSNQLQEYVSIRSYRLENKRFGRKAEMTVLATFRRPGQKEFSIRSESGSGMIRERVLHRMLDSELEASRDPMRRATQITPENYTFRLIGLDKDRGRRAYLFEISPKVLNKFMIRGRIWLDAEDFAITRIEGSPAKNPSVLIRGTNFVHIYDKMGPFWLAASNSSDSDSLLFGRTSVVIRYADYKIRAAQ